MSQAPSAPPRDSIEQAARHIAEVRAELARRIVGQHEVITQVLAAILSEGHALILGLPGLAKTLLVSSIAEILSLEFKRIQFTPDLMPSDITGANIISDQGEGGRGFHFLKGPIFSNIILADEINRTPPKTQSAMMEAMEERQVSVGGARLPMSRPFFVLATQNPLEHEGTYPLPVSQLDRFLFSISIDYPSADEEFEVVLRTTSTYEARLKSLVTREDVLGWIQVAQGVTVPPDVLSYITRIVRATRAQGEQSSVDLDDRIAWGGGPRATQALILASRALALMAGRGAVRQEDVHAVALPALRHRVVLKYHAQADGAHTDDVLEKLLETVSGGSYPTRQRRVGSYSGKKQGKIERWIRSVWSRASAASVRSPRPDGA